MKRYRYIYCITNLLNGKNYIGKHAPTDNEGFDRYYGSGSIIKNAIKKYGKQNFSKSLLFEGILTNEEINEAEKYYIWLARKSGKAEYNICDGGEGVSNLYGELNSFYNKKHSEETKKKISEANKGRSHKENRAKIIIKCVETGEINSLYEFEKKLGSKSINNKGYVFYRSAISNCLKGEIESYKGYHFELIADERDEKIKNHAMNVSINYNADNIRNKKTKDILIQCVETGEINSLRYFAEKLNLIRYRKNGLKFIESARLKRCLINPNYMCKNFHWREINVTNNDDNK